MTRKVFWCAAALVAVAGAANAANVREFPTRNGGSIVPEVRYFSIVDPHRDITTTVRRLSAGGYDVEARFSQGDKITGTHMCSSVVFRDAQRYEVARIGQRAGLNAAGFGPTLVRTLNDGVNLSPADTDKVEFIQISQEECPSSTALQSLQEAINIFNNTFGNNGNNQPPGPTPPTFPPPDESRIPTVLRDGDAVTKTGLQSPTPAPTPRPVPVRPPPVDGPAPRLVPLPQ